MKPELTNDDHGTISEEEDYINRKKLRLSKDQSSFLEQSFKQNTTLNPRQKLGIAKHLKLRPRQVEVWFQNRRARTKLKQTEIDCSILKRCWESLTEENQRLKIEVEDLRALKLTNGLHMEMSPPIILNLCTSCQNGGVHRRR
ncbi:homeobox-leucine zipper protein HAT4-like [Impatiens glandulifera]|uniref:homeobox-leucine zipper protein HAT4-like n=1 Tax=Impatiens glandulifera TaxID=253017 RepID=UPI001FB10B70|nr:homeobox-leucine zipper protein HAT4-like [Impatiens glandulifera]